MPTRTELNFIEMWRACAVDDVAPVEAVIAWINDRPMHLIPDPSVVGFVTKTDRASGFGWDWHLTPAGRDLIETARAIGFDPTTARADDEPLAPSDPAPPCPECNGDRVVPVPGMAYEASLDDRDPDACWSMRCPACAGEGVAVQLDRDRLVDEFIDGVAEHATDAIEFERMALAGPAPDGACRLTFNGREVFHGAPEPRHRDETLDEIHKRLKAMVGRRVQIIDQATGSGSGHDCGSGTLLSVERCVDGIKCDVDGASFKPTVTPVGGWSWPDLVLADPQDEAGASEAPTERGADDGWAKTPEEIDAVLHEALRTGAKIETQPRAYDRVLRHDAIDQDQPWLLREHDGHRLWCLPAEKQLSDNIGWVGPISAVRLAR